MLDPDLNCSIIRYASQLKNDIKYISVKQSILEWIETVRNDDSELQYLSLAIEHYYPEHLNYLNTILLLK
jgi:hypothetical protein